MIAAPPNEDRPMTSALRPPASSTPASVVDQAARAAKGAASEEAKGMAAAADVANDETVVGAAETEPAATFDRAGPRLGAPRASQPWPLAMLCSPSIADKARGLEALQRGRLHSADLLFQPLLDVIELRNAALTAAALKVAARAGFGPKELRALIDVATAEISKATDESEDVPLVDLGDVLPLIAQANLSTNDDLALRVAKRFIGPDSTMEQHSDLLRALHTLPLDEEMKGLVIDHSVDDAWPNSICLIATSLPGLGLSADANHRYLAKALAFVEDPAAFIEARLGVDVRGDKSAELRAAAAPWVALGAVQLAQDPRVAVLVTRMAASEHPDVRCAVAAELAALVGIRGDALGLIDQLLGDQDPKVGTAAAWAIGRIEDPAVRRATFESVLGNDAVDLGRTPVVTALTTLIALSARAPSVVAALAVGVLRDPRLTPAQREAVLTRFARGADAKVAGAALREAASLAADGVLDSATQKDLIDDHLERALTSPDVAVGVGLIAKLGDVGPELRRRVFDALIASEDLATLAAGTSIIGGNPKTKNVPNAEAAPMANAWGKRISDVPYSYGSAHSFAEAILNTLEADGEDPATVERLLTL
jgi:hypothetical protein